MQVSISFLPGPLCRFTPSSSFNNSGYQGEGVEEKGQLLWGLKRVLERGHSRLRGESKKVFSQGAIQRENKSWQSLAHLLPVHFPHLCGPSPSRCAQGKPKGSAQGSVDS